MLILQEIEAQQLLDKIREYAKPHSKPWGSPNRTKEKLSRSQSRPLLAPTNQAAKAWKDEERKQRIGTSRERDHSTGSAGSTRRGVGAASSPEPRMEGAILGPERMGQSLASMATARPGSAGAALQTRGGTISPSPVRLVHGAAPSPSSLRRSARRPGTASARASGSGLVDPANAYIRSDYASAHVRRLEEEVEALRQTVNVLLSTTPQVRAPGESNSLAAALQEAVTAAGGPSLASRPPARKGAARPASLTRGSGRGGGKGRAAAGTAGSALNDSALDAASERSSVDGSGADAAGTAVGVLLREKQRADARVLKLERERRSLESAAKGAQRESALRDKQAAAAAAAGTVAGTVADASSGASEAAAAFNPRAQGELWKRNAASASERRASQAGADSDSKLPESDDADIAATEPAEEGKPRTDSQSGAGAVAAEAGAAEEGPEFASDARKAYLAALAQGADYSKPARRGSGSVDEDGKEVEAASQPGRRSRSQTQRPRSAFARIESAASGKRTGTDGAEDDGGSSGSEQEDGEGRRSQRPQTAGRTSGLAAFLQRCKEDDERKRRGEVRLTYSMKKTLQFMHEHEAEITKELNTRFVAKPVPDCVKQKGLLRQILQENEERRRREHAERTEQLRKSVRPFKQLNQHEEEMRARSSAARAKLLLETAREGQTAAQFKAVPVPVSLTQPDGEYQALLRREKDRPARIAAGARALAASSSLPPRMTLAVEQAKRSRSERSASLKREQDEEDKKHRFRANHMPDFAGMQRGFLESLVHSRKSSALTHPQPFGFDKAERKQEEDERKASVQRQYNLITSYSMELREAALAGKVGMASTLKSLVSPALEASVRFGDNAASPRARGRSRPGSARSDSALQRQRPGSAHSSGGDSVARRSLRPDEVARKLSVNHAPPAAMTRAVQLKMMETQRLLRERQEKERQKALEEETRQAQMREVARGFGSIFSELERQRRPIPLAWQPERTGENVVNSATLARRAFERDSKQREAEAKRRVEDAQRNRVFLFVRQSLEAKREAARRDALLAVAKNLGESVDMPWERVAAEGQVEGAPMFDDDDRELLGLARDGKAAGQGVVPGL
jgi:colicin import membrane protein